MSLMSLADHDPAWLDKMYNNRVLVPEHGEIFTRWRADSAHVRHTERCFLDVAYGRGPNESLDLFVAPESSPDWRALDKSDQSFVAPAFTARGAHVVVPNYALCPAVTVPEITMQMVKALAWVWRNIARFGGDPERITVAGHSVGGHMVAMLLNCAWSQYAQDLPHNLVKHAVSLSGLFELESIRKTPFLADLHLTQADAHRASPAWMPAPAQGTLDSVVGGDESEAFLLHNQMIQHAWGKKCVPVCEALPGLNHFTIVDALTQPTHRLHQLVAQRIAP